MILRNAESGLSGLSNRRNGIMILVALEEYTKNNCEDFSVHPVGKDVESTCDQ